MGLEASAGPGDVLWGTRETGRKALTLDVAAEHELRHERAITVSAVRVGQHDGDRDEQLGSEPCVASSMRR